MSRLNLYKPHTEGNKADSPGKDLLSIGHDSLVVKGQLKECWAEDGQRDWVVCVPEYRYILISEGYRMRMCLH